MTLIWTKFTFLNLLLVLDPKVDCIYVSLKGGFLWSFVVTFVTVVNIFMSSVNVLLVSSQPVFSVPLVVTFVTTQQLSFWITFLLMNEPVVFH